MPRLKTSSISPGQLSLFDCKPEPLPLLPDPWMLPLDEVISKPQFQTFSAKQSKPLLFLPAAKKETASSVPITTEPTLDELFLGIDIDKLQLRLARKIAKELGISQKVNGCDQKLSWLHLCTTKHLDLLRSLFIVPTVDPVSQPTPDLSPSYTCFYV